MVTAMPKPAASKPIQAALPVELRTLDQLDAAAAVAKWRDPPEVEGEWHRVRKVHQNGVYGWVLEKLTVLDGDFTTERLHDPDQRDIILGKLMREVELGA